MKRKGREWLPRRTTQRPPSLAEGPQNINLGETYNARLCVYSKNALKTGQERRHRRPVSVEKEIIILKPIRKHVVRYHSPSAFPYLGVIEEWYQTYL